MDTDETDAAAFELFWSLTSHLTSVPAGNEVFPFANSTWRIFNWEQVAARAGDGVIKVKAQNATLIATSNAITL